MYICHINGQISYTWSLFNLNNTVLCRVAVIWIESWLSSHPPEFWFLQKPDCVVKYNYDKDNHPHIIEIFKGGPYAHYWYFLPLWHASYFCWLSWLLGGIDPEPSLWPSSLWQFIPQAKDSVSEWCIWGLEELQLSGSLNQWTSSGTLLITWPLHTPTQRGLSMSTQTHCATVLKCPRFSLCPQ